MSDLERPATGRPFATKKTAGVIVVIMTALLVLALLGVIWGFVHQSRLFMAARMHGRSTDAGADAATIVLAPGARIVSAATDAGKLVLHVETPSGGEVEIIDLATGKRTGQIKTRP